LAGKSSESFNFIFFIRNNKANKMFL